MTATTTHTWTPYSQTWITTWTADAPRWASVYLDSSPRWRWVVLTPHGQEECGIADDREAALAAAERAIGDAEKKC